MTLYRGYELLETEPNRREDPDAEFSRVGLRTAPVPSSVIVVDDPWGASRVARPFTWFLDSEQAIVDFYAWLARRRGRYVPVWVPTWHHDLVLTADVSSASITIEHMRYASDLFADEARRHLAFITPTRQVIPRRVLSATSSSATETLVLESSPGALPKASTMLCWLQLMRLASDDVEVVFHRTGLAEAVAQLVEIPKALSPLARTLSGSVSGAATASANLTKI